MILVGKQNSDTQQMTLSHECKILPTDFIKNLKILDFGRN